MNGHEGLRDLIPGKVTIGPEHITPEDPKSHHTVSFYKTFNQRAKKGKPKEKPYAIAHFYPLGPEVHLNSFLFFIISLK
jgi:hypothetical protein